MLIACAEGVVDTSDDPGGDAAAGTHDAEQKDGSPSDGGADAPPSACQTSLANAHFDFESGTQGWTHDVMDNAEPEAPGWPFDVWGQGIGGNTLGCHAGS